MDASEVDASETDSVVGDLHEVAMVSDLQVTEEYELGPDDVPPPEDQSELGDESVRGSDDEMDAVNEACEGETSGEPQALETLHGPIEDMSAQQLTAHTSAVFAVSVNAANPYFFATGGGDDVGYLWRVGLAEPVARLQGHSETISSIGFSADGNYLATGGLDGIVRVWSADAGEPVVALEGPTQGINWVAWHSRGAVLLAGSEDATAWMWKVPEGSVMQIFSVHSGSVSYGGFANGGRNIITASEDGTVRVWNPRAGTVDHCLHASSPQEPYAITCLAAHPSQAVYLFGIETGAVKMAHAETGAPQSGSSTRASPPSRARSQKPPFSAEPLPCRATPPWILRRQSSGGAQQPRRVRRERRFLRLHAVGCHGKYGRQALHLGAQHVQPAAHVHPRRRGGRAAMAKAVAAALLVHRLPGDSAVGCTVGRVPQGPHRSQGRSALHGHRVRARRHLPDQRLG